jgi:hypothetical protein
VGEMRELFLQVSDKEALTWLSAISPDSPYDFNKYRRLEGTCEWIFKTQKYQSWIEGSGNRDLWVVGIPGKPLFRFLRLTNSMSVQGRESRYWPQTSLTNSENAMNS